MLMQVEGSSELDSKLNFFSFSLFWKFLPHVISAGNTEYHDEIFRQNDFRNNVDRPSLGSLAVHNISL